jgi:hypothetical protein
VIKQLGDPEATLRTQRLTKSALYTGGGIGLLIAYAVLTRALADPLIVMLIAAFSGNAIGIAAILGYNIKQWPITAPYLDKDKVTKRLNELDT